MKKSYSTCIIPQTSEGLLFSLQCDDYLYHCWASNQQFVLIKESNNFALCEPNQLLNFTERELKRYLYNATKQLKELDNILFFNELLWCKYCE
ncbi:MAG: hypothetical protein IT215_02990 [Chitinophagaceae bacterium]|nr:hypothetical protein [Chitinophagaceae bacterium]